MAQHPGRVRGARLLARTLNDGLNPAGSVRKALPFPGEALLSLRESLGASGERERVALCEKCVWKKTHAEGVEMCEYRRTRTWGKGAVDTQECECSKCAGCAGECAS